MEKIIQLKKTKLLKNFLDELKKKKHVYVSIENNEKGKTLMWEGKQICVFDVCRCGNQEYNAVTVVRDLLNSQNTSSQWTRKMVENLLIFN